jgi:NAD(P)-dependent dehydrogenase (short-subunit alcohol dehydrogenase family)
MDAGQTGVASLMRIVLQEHGRFGITANIIATDLFATKAAEALV